MQYAIIINIAVGNNFLVPSTKPSNASSNFTLQVNLTTNVTISINTIKAHVANILQKLEVEDRLQAALKAIKYQIV